MNKVIFFGNGPLADYALAILEQECQIIFHAHSTADLARACELKHEHPDAHGVLASFGVIIKQQILDLFEPEGILNIHPSLLPKYRGPSPIESAILDGDDDFSVSVIKLVKEMDAGPIYTQATLSGLPLDKLEIYRHLAETGARMVIAIINKQNEKSRHPQPQNEKNATFCSKLDKSMSFLAPETDTAEKTLRKIVAFQGFPKPKYTFYGIGCIILEAHILEQGKKAALTFPCADGQIISIDRLQPAGKRPMDAKSFINGYKK